MGLFSLTVNVSVRQLLDSRFLNLVREVLRESRINPERLILEITEEAATENIGDTLAQMTALRECGIRFSLDHFGTGHCSVSSLARLPLNQLKIDRSFVKDVLTDVKAAAHVRTIIALGKSLNLAIIAEGVDTEGECKFLEKEGCYTYQGNLFAPAMPFSQLKAFVAQARLLRGLLIPAALVQ
jgi:EAL domain-containing protein (putative c-di-GMP-specific phosphodiesterase class I)